MSEAKMDLAIKQHEKGDVLGLKVDITNYSDACKRIEAIARSGCVAAVAAANTHLVGECLRHSEFADVMKTFDFVLPDGMPLVWALRLDGHEINDRVYGPYFMEHVLMNASSGSRHYFFGGTQECLDKLQDAARTLNPQIQISGAKSPPFGLWDEATETRLIDDINAAQADFIWVALGGVKQETWIAKNRHRFTRGVFLAVGDAFVLVAGQRSYAPAWVQRVGMTWLFRMLQEPRRLLSRYLRYNTLFAVAFLKERLRLAYGDN